MAMDLFLSGDNQKYFKMNNAVHLLHYLYTSRCEPLFIIVVEIVDSVENSPKAIYVFIRLWEFSKHVVEKSTKIFRRAQNYHLDLSTSAALYTILLIGNLTSGI
jgi:hypothetical protein